MHRIIVAVLVVASAGCVKGEKGDPGRQGDQGVQGVQGDPGPQGAVGPTGTWSAIDGGVAQAIATTVTVNAKSDCGSISPAAHMEVFVNHVRIGGSDITASTYADVQFSLPSPSFIGELAVVYTNDGNAGGCDHNLYVDHITLSTGASISSGNTEHVLFDKMNGTDFATAFDGVDVAPASPSMPVTGGLRFFVGATGHLSGLGGAADPIFSTKANGTRFTSTTTGVWEATGESITLSAPPERPARYRIAARQMWT